MAGRRMLRTLKNRRHMILIILAIMLLAISFGAEAVLGEKPPEPPPIKTAAADQPKENPFKIPPALHSPLQAIAEANSRVKPQPHPDLEGRGHATIAYKHLPREIDLPLGLFSRKSAEIYEQTIVAIQTGRYLYGDRVVYVTRSGNYTFTRGQPSLAIYSFWRGIQGLTSFNMTLDLETRDGTPQPIAYDEQSLPDRYVARIIYPEGFMTVVWDFGRDLPKMTVYAAHAGGFRVVWRISVPDDMRVDAAPGFLGLVDHVTLRDGVNDYRVDWNDEGLAEAYYSPGAVTVKFTWNDGLIDPCVQVFGPTAVDPGFNSTGEKTLLTMSTTLPAGGQNVIITSYHFGTTDISAYPSGTLRIKKDSTILYETKISGERLVGGGQRGKPIMLMAVDASPAGNDAYTFTINITSAASSSASVHVQGIVIKTLNAAWAYNTSAVSIAAGATATVVSLSTSYPANSNVVALAFIYPYNTGAAHALLGAGNVKLKLNTTVISSNQFSPGSYQTIEPAHVNLAWLGTVTTSTQTWSVEVTNGSSYTLGAYAIIVTFMVVNGALLDTGSVALTSGSQVTVGSLSTSLVGNVVVIGLAAAENTGTSGVTAFNAGGVVLQKDNLATNQVSLLVGWYLEATSSHGRSGITPLFRYDANAVNPTYQIKMTAAVSGINGEAKILAFTLPVTVTINIANKTGPLLSTDYFPGQYLDGLSKNNIQLQDGSVTLYLNPSSNWIYIPQLSTLSNSTVRWALNYTNGFNQSFTADTTLTIYYWKQFNVTLIIVTSKPYSAKTSSSNYATVTATTFSNTQKAYNVWENGTNPTVWADAGGSLSWSSTTSASTSTHRWVTPGPVTIQSIQSPSISQAIYYEQYLVTLAVSSRYQNYTKTSSSNYFTGYCSRKFNGTLTLAPIYDGLSQTDWCDYAASLTMSQTSSASTAGKQWLIQGQSYKATGSATYTFLYDVYDLIRLEVAAMNKLNISSLMWLQLRDGLGTVYSVQPSQYFYARDNFTHSIVNATWRTIPVVTGYFNMTYLGQPTGPRTYYLTYTKIWSNLAGSGMEIYLESGASAYASIWDGENEILFVWTTQPETGGSTYLYYGQKYAAPVNVYVGGYKILQGSWTCDPGLRVVKVPISGGAFAFDFTGKLAESLVGKQTPVYIPYPVLIPQPGAVVNISQPAGYPQIVIPSINITDAFKPLILWVKPYYDLIAARIPVPMPILIGVILFATLFAGFYKLLSRVRWRESQPVQLETGEKIVVRVEPPRFTRMFIQTAITTVLIGTLFYYVFPNMPVLNNYFTRLNMPWHVFFIMMLVIALFVSAIVYLMMSEGYRVSRAGGGRARK